MLRSAGSGDVARGVILPSDLALPHG
jgi:hypothetical protein